LPLPTEEEEPEQQDDRDRHADEPQQNALSHVLVLRPDDLSARQNEARWSRFLTEKAQ
jgi:hypothetical protein